MRRHPRRSRFDLAPSTRSTARRPPPASKPGAPAPPSETPPPIERAATTEVDDLVHPFFSTDDLAPTGLGDGAPSPDEASARTARIFSATAVARRHRFTRVVAGVLGACALCGVLAAARVLFARVDADAPAMGGGSRVGAPHRDASPAEPGRPSPPASAVSTEPGALSADVEGARANTAEVGAIAPAADATCARLRTREAKALLARGDAVGAARAAADATVLDPGSAEAWWVLGAAHEARGARTDARLAYRTCVAQGRGGPRSECAALLRR